MRTADRPPGPAHVRFRRVFDAGFTGARVRGMVPLMRERATGLIDRFAGLARPELLRPTRVASARRMADYTRYLQALIDDRRERPREDLISDLVHGANGYPGGRMSTCTT